jgi:hypothetical protein
MGVNARWWAALALAGSVSGQAFSQPIYVQSAPIHPAIEEPDGGPNGPAPPPNLGDPAPSAVMPPSDLMSQASAPAGLANPGPQVAISRRVIDAAGAFDGYMRRASAIKASFSSGGAVARAVELGSVYEPAQLEQGAIAYAALVALQDPLFVEAVQEVGRDPRTREVFAQRLVDQPNSVMTAPVARKAAAHVSAVLGRMGAQLVVAGAAVKQAAYDVQHQEWSKAAIASPDERLARIKAQSAVEVSLLPADTAQLIGGLSAYRAMDADAQAEGQATSPVVTRGMALAALAILGKAGDDQAERVSALLTDPNNAQCIKRAKLDLFECLAVAGPHYENLFCLGHHGMMETGQCIVSASGVDDASIRPLVDTRSVYVPVAVASAVASGAGPERASVFGGPPTTTNVSVPLAAPEAPANYSPYAGPVER